MSTAAATPQRTDLRLVGPALATWAGAGVGLSVPHAVTLVCAVALGGGAGCVALAAARGSRIARGRALLRMGALCAALACAALLVADLRVAPLRTGPVAALARDSATAAVWITVTSDPVRHAGRASGQQRRADLVVVGARASRVEARGRSLAVRLPITVLATGPGWDALLPGARVRAEGRLGARRGNDPVVAVLSVRAAPERIGRPGPVQRAAGGLRSGLRRAVAGLDPPERGLVPGLVDGDTSQLPDDVAEDFRTAGLTHLTAVSGANVAILLGAVLLLARRAGLRGLALPALGVLALLGFVVLARPQPSVLRAAAMGLVALLALASGRRRSGVPALGAAVLGLVLLDPWQSLAFGFALSVLATAALLLLAPPIVHALRRRRVPEPLAMALAVPVSATLLTAPVTVLLSGTVSLVSVPANLLVAPAVAPATVLGFAAAVVSPLWPWGAALLGRLAGLPAHEMVVVARWAAGVRGGAVPWAASLGGGLALAAVLLAGVLLLPLVMGNRVVRAAAVAGSAALLAQPVVAPHWPPGDWVLVACDVGQGDALVLRGDAGGDVLIDAGPDPRAVDSCLRDLGVTRLAAVVLTHFHADHVEGLPGALRHRSVAEINVTPLAQPVGEVERVRRWASEAGLTTRVVVAGEQRSIGGAEWRVVSPAHVVPDEGPNNASVVLLVTAHGLRILLTGDIEPESQREIGAQAQTLLGGPVDVLKVPHHGSAHQDAGLLEWLRPALSLVCVGAHNDYGHPSAATLGLLERAGSLVGRTDVDGALAVVVRDGRAALVRRGAAR